MDVLFYVRFRTCLRFVCALATAIATTPDTRTSTRACGEDVQLCLNGGACFERTRAGQTKYFCNCPAPYSGYTCDINQTASGREETSRSLMTTGTAVPCEAHNRLCENGGTCYRVLQTDRNFGYSIVLFGCSCKPGFYGGFCQSSGPEVRTGDETTACNPNPCMNECDCVLSCKHELGYYCISDDGYVGKNCNIEVPNVSCGMDSIVISIPHAFYEEFDAGANNSYFYLTPDDAGISNSPSCRVDQRSYELLQIGTLVFNLSLPFTECQTALELSEEAAIFSNTLWVNRDYLGDGVDMPVRVIDWQCAYDRNYSIVSSIEPVIHQNTTVVNEDGSYEVLLDLCKVGSCPARCPEHLKVQSGAIYTVGQRIYLTIKTQFAGNDEPRNGLVTTVSEMFLSCSVDPAQPRLADLVMQGCQRQFAAGMLLDVTTGLVEESQSTCLSFLVPRSKCPKFYVHILVQLCQHEQLQSCTDHSETKHCTSRRIRRSSADPEDGQHAAIGPISVIDGVAGSGHVQLYPDHSPSVARAATNRPTSQFPSNDDSRAALKPINVRTLLFGICCGTLTVALLVAWSKRIRTTAERIAMDV